MMVRRILATHFAALHLFVSGTWCLADTPLVIAELDAQQATAAAAAEQAAAEHQLAAWQLAQTKSLQSEGFASWQEVAEQEVAVETAKAAAQGAQRYHQHVLEWQARMTKSTSSSKLPESEWIRLFMPASARLVASIPTDVAAAALSKRHLENLRNESKSIAEIDLSALQAAVEKAEREVAYRRSEDNADLLEGAVIRLRVAQAEYKTAQGRKAEAAIIARRIELTGASLAKQQAEPAEPSPAIAQLGTRLVDATSDAQLDRLTIEMASDHLSANKQLAWLQLQHDMASGRIESLQELATLRGGDDRELKKAQKELADLELQMGHTKDLLKLRQQIAGSYQRTSETSVTDSAEPEDSSPVELVRFADANIVRHLLELQRLQFEREAKLVAAQAQRDYLTQRCRRVELIPAEARPPKELDDLRRKIQSSQLQLAIIEADLALLSQEQKRFCRQVESQRGDQYQLVQAADGQFISREQFELGASLIAAVGMVGSNELASKSPTFYPYLESPAFLDLVTGDGVEGLGPIAPNDDAADTSPGESQQQGESQQETLTSYGWRLTIDGFAFSPNRFCYGPFLLRAPYLQYRWAAYQYWRGPYFYRSRTLTSYEPYHYNYWWNDPYWFRVYRPARLDSCFGGYWYRSAYPNWSRIYAPAYSRPLSPYGWYGYGWGFGCGCFR